MSRRPKNNCDLLILSVSFSPDKSRFDVISFGSSFESMGGDDGIEYTTASKKAAAD